MDIVYLTIDDVLSTYEKTVEISGGGMIGIKDKGQLESVLANIQNDDYYPTFSAKLTHLFFSLVKFHCFVDGNKRAAVTTCVHMLIRNGYMFCVAGFMREMENITVEVAKDVIDKDLLGEIITAHIEQKSEDESLKLKILEAITANLDPNEG